MHRRSFIQGATLLGITPLLMSTLPLLPEAETYASLLTSVPTPEDKKDTNTVVFTIDGWDHFAPEDRSRNAVAISLNQSWRTAWR